MRIQSKLRINAALPLALVLFTAAVLFVALRYVNDAGERNRLASSIVKEVFELTIITDEYLLNHAERAQRQWDLKYASLGQLLQGIGSAEAGEQAIVHRIYQEHQGLKATFTELVRNQQRQAALSAELQEPLPSKTTKQRLDVEMQRREQARKEAGILAEFEARLVGQLLSKSQAMVSGGLQLSNISQIKVTKAQQSGALAIFGFVALMGTVIAVTSLLINRSVVRPIVKVKEGTEIVAGGNLDYRLGIDRDDEIGDLSRTFDQMMDHLKATTASRDELDRAHAELKNSTAQLVQAEKMASIGQMVAGVAHEINTPLAYVRSSVEIVKDEMPDIERLVAAYRELGNMLVAGADEEALGKQFELVSALAQEFERTHSLSEATTLLTRAVHGIDQIRELVMNLKNFSRMDREKITDYDLNQGLDNVLLLATPVLKKRIKVVRDYGEIPAIVCSPSQINQVFLNVISNAAQAIEGENGVITIQTRAKADGAVVTIQDNGKGIPKEVLPRIFDPFFTTKKVGEGTGLGLSISHKIVEEHGGSIAIDSVVGGGATVTVTLPIREQLGQRLRA